MYRHPRYYKDDPEPEPDELVTPRHMWASDNFCNACMQAAATTCYIERGDGVDPAKFRLCHDHAVNVALSGGEVFLDN